MKSDPGKQIPSEGGRGISQLAKVMVIETEARQMFNSAVGGWLTQR